MIRIALLGCDSTHTEAFGQLINGADAPFGAEAKVVALYGVDMEQARTKATALAIPRVAASPDEALHEADFAMVIGRFADSHTAPALAAIERGIPTFVDKPFTESVVQARKLIAAARTNGVPLCSSSPLRFAKEVVELRQGDGPATFLSSAPAVCTDLGPDPRLNSAFFYGIHALEMLIELAGHDIETKQITYGRRFINVHLDMTNGNAAQLQLVRDTPEFYSIGRIDAAGQTHRTIELDGAYYRAEMKHLLEEFLPGKQRIPLESSETAIALLEEIDLNDRFRVP
jgi:hypothetical protein